MSNPSVEVISPKLFPGIVADELVAAIGDSIADAGTCSIVLSGGKTPASMYRELSHPPRVDDVDWGNVKLFWGDERYVPSDNVHSNSKMVHDTLLDNISEPKPEVHSIDVNLSTPEEVAEHYEQTLRKALDVADGEMPVFDIVLLGIGDDGHIASLFPGSDLLSESNWLCSAVTENCGEYPRITLSPDALFSAKKIYFLVKGEGKAGIVKKIMDGDANEMDIPAMLYKRASERVTWFIDSQAANKIEQDLS